MAAPMLSMACPAVRIALPKLLTREAAMASASDVRCQYGVIDSALSVGVVMGT